jgi:hypothetical protein
MDAERIDLIENTFSECIISLDDFFIFFPIICTDRVFGKDVATRHVYEEGAREVAMSVVRGINCMYLQSNKFSHALLFVIFVLTCVLNL